MEKEYINITDYKKMGFNFSFDNMVKVLLSAKEEGDLVYCSFNGHLFYSDTITEEQAYLDYYDMLKQEREYYKENKNEVVIGIISSAASRLCVPDELYKDYITSVISWSHSPDTLQIFDYTKKLSENILSGYKEDEYIKRFKGFADDRKLFLLRILNKYYDNRYKNYFINVLDLEDMNKHVNQIGRNNII